MNKIIVSIPLLLSLMTVTVIGLPIEKQAQAESIIGNTADGYEYRQRNGRARLTKWLQF